MAEPELKADLCRYLQDARDALLWKLEGLSEYDIRRPLVATGTNLLGSGSGQEQQRLRNESDSFSAAARSAWLKPITWERVTTDGMLIGPGPPGYPGQPWRYRCLPRPRGMSRAR
jgi:hypothetical protein